jgi:pilus assembly protein CpaC
VSVRWSWLLALAAVLGDAAVASAQSRGGEPQTLRVDREVGAARELALEAGQNRLLLLSEEIARVAVANPEVADLKVVTPMQVLLTAKGVGNTDLTLWNRANQPLVISLQVARNLDLLRKQIHELFPGQEVKVSAAGDLVVLSGQVSDVRMPVRIAELARLHAKQVANLVQVTGNQQVQLEVHFAEVTRAGIRQIGVNFFHKDKNGYRVGGITTPQIFPGDFLNTTNNPAIPGTGPRGLYGNGLPPDVPNPSFPRAFNLFLSQAGEFPFSAMLSLLESNNLAKVLAEPTLVTLSGQEARFMAGGELPIPLSSAFGSVNVDWKKFGILLNFTPTVIDESTIHLKLAAEVSDLDPTIAVTIGGTVIPGIATRQSETTVRLGDGQSFAIAGLLSEKVRSAIDKVPWLGSIPILGALFRSTDFQREESELMVVVTARLARPMAPHEVPPLPTDREDNDPGNLQLFLLGSDSSARSPAEIQAAAARRGPAGSTGFGQ